MFDHVHLLGSHCPFEKMFYGDEVDTMDTGYPVKLGMKGEQLLKESKKPNIIIDEFLNDDLDPYIRERIILNVMKFKGL